MGREGALIICKVLFFLSEVADTSMIVMLLLQCCYVITFLDVLNMSQQNRCIYIYVYSYRDSNNFSIFFSICNALTNLRVLIDSSLLQIVC